MKNFVIYRSSAGSGKTYTLVKEYIRLALSSESGYRHILAVTFTNKAAEEMKTRIITSLIALSNGENKLLEEQLLSEGVTGNISLKASQALQNILHKYSYFSVLTIDSFFLKIIRSFARELSLPLGYNIELKTDIVLDRITEELLDEIGTKPELTKYIEDYVFYSIEENKGWKIDRRIKELAQEIFKERYWIKKGDDGRLADNIEKMQSFITMLFKLKDEFEKQMRGYSDAASVVLDNYSLKIEDFPYGRSGFMNYLADKIKKKDFDPTSRVFEAAENLAKWRTKTSRPEVMLAANDGLFNILQDTVGYYNENIKNYSSAKELVKTIHVLGIYRDLMDKLKNYRDDNRLMIISDINNILIKIISGDNTPFIYEKTGTIYKNFLIDEFQDTSSYQWKNFFPLIENSLSENNFSMIVGDVKQSIYRWRNGNMKLLLGEVKDDLAAFSSEIDEKYLNENYRSRKEIIEFNNKFFTSAAQKLIEKPGDKGNYITSSYFDVLQESGSAIDGGYVNIEFFPDTGEEVSGRELALEKSVEAAKDALVHGYMQKDIMVLTRSRADGIETAHYLSNSGFKVVSADSLLLTNSPKVKLLISILKYIVDRKDNLSRTEILYNYLVYIKNESPDLNAVLNDYKVYEGSMFSERLPAEFFSENNRTRLNPLIYRLNLYELIEMLVRIFELNHNIDAYLLRFMEVVTDFTLENSSDIAGFIEWWNENNYDYSIIIPEQEDAIRVMTIHMAKGLQSPVVIMPCANWGTEINGMRDLIWVSSDQPPFNESSAFLVRAAKALEKSHFEDDYSEEAALTRLDNLNLLYVAFTRAKERLHIFLPEGNDRTTATTYKLIQKTLTGSEELNGNFVSETVFEAGKRTIHKIKDDLPDHTYKSDELISSKYTSKVVIKSSAKGLTIEKKKKLEESRNRGRIIHEVLSLVKYPEDAERAVKKLTVNGLITADNEDEILSELVEILKMDEVRSWFSKEYEIKNETELILPGGSLYKPDRVLLKDLKAIVIDYKTGKHNKENVKQVNEYADILSNMGYTDIEKYLFYLPERKIVKV